MEKNRKDLYFNQILKGEDIEKQKEKLREEKV